MRLVLDILEPITKNTFALLAPGLDVNLTPKVLFLHNLSANLLDPNLGQRLLDTGAIALHRGHRITITMTLSSDV